jgi:hypothetical protein
MQFRALSTVRKHMAALVAVVALLGQAIFPHVHALDARDARRLAAHPLAFATLARCIAACPTVLAAAAVPTPAGDADHHSSSSCPLCRAQSDARSSLLPSALVVPAPVAAAAPPPADTVASVVAVARTLAAPRAPPVAS